jgi:hypothetical protein
MIQPGQTYRSADPRGGPRIRIKTYTPGHDRAYVVDAYDGKRPRWIQARQLHATGNTVSGQPRRTGYILEAAS